MSKLTDKQKEILASQLQSNGNGGFNYNLFNKDDVDKAESFYENNLQTIEINEKGKFTKNSRVFAKYCARRVFEPIINKKIANNGCKTIADKIYFMDTVIKSFYEHKYLNQDKGDLKSKYADVKKYANTDKIKESLDAMASNGIEVKIRYADKKGKTHEIKYDRSTRKAKKLTDEAFRKLRYATYRKVSSFDNVIDRDQFFTNLLISGNDASLTNLAFDDILAPSLNEQSLNKIKKNAQELIDATCNLNNYSGSLENKIDDLDTILEVCENFYKKLGEVNKVAEDKNVDQNKEKQEEAIIDKPVKEDVKEKASQKEIFSLDEIRKTIAERKTALQELDKTREKNGVKIGEDYVLVSKLNNPTIQSVKDKAKQIFDYNLPKRDDKVSNRTKFENLVAYYNTCKKLCDNDRNVMDKLGQDVLKQLNKLRIRDFRLEKRGLEKTYIEQQNAMDDILIDLGKTPKRYGKAVQDRIEKREKEKNKVEPYVEDEYDWLLDENLKKDDAPKLIEENSKKEDNKLIEEEPVDLLNKSFIMDKRPVDFGDDLSDSFTINNAEPIKGNKKLNKSELNNGSKKNDAPVIQNRN